MNWLRYFYDRLFKYNEFNVDYEKDSVIKYNTYGKEMKTSEFVKRGNIIHKWLKYIILIPGLSLLEWLFGRYLLKKVPKTNTLKNLYLLSESYEKSIEDWCKVWRCSNTDGHNYRNHDKLTGFMNDNSSSCLRKIFRLFSTIIQHDTAYLEFFNILVYNHTIKMNKMYSKGLDKNGKIDHLLYTSKTINDIRYLTIIGDIPEKKRFIINNILKDNIKICEIKEVKQSDLIKAAYQSEYKYYKELRKQYLEEKRKETEPYIKDENRIA